MEQYRVMKYEGSQRHHSSGRQGEPVTWRRVADKRMTTTLNVNLIVPEILANEP